jgi:hypothetical protein
MRITHSHEGIALVDTGVAVMPDPLTVPGSLAERLVCYSVMPFFGMMQQCHPHPPSPQPN